LSIAIVSLLVLVVVAIVAIPILIQLFGSAARRNPNRAEDEEDREHQQRESGDQNR
jgi:flagellar basal body-associated protein FliL